MHFCTLATSAKDCIRPTSAWPLWKQSRFHSRLARKPARVSAKFTLDYGLRFSWFQPQYDARNQVAIFDPGSYDPSKAVRLYMPAVGGGAYDPASPATIVDGSLTGTIVPGSGDRLNGMRFASDGYYRGGWQDRGLMLEPRFDFAYAPGGLIDSDRADRDWELNTHPAPRSPRALARRHSADAGFAQARTVRAHYEALLARHEYERRSPELVDANKVKIAACKVDGIFREYMLGIPDIIQTWLLAYRQEHGRGPQEQEVYSILSLEIRNAPTESVVDVTLDAVSFELPPVDPWVMHTPEDEQT